MQAAGVTAQQYMDTWLKQINYPVVDIVLKQNQNGATVEFIQNRFSLSIYDEEELFPPIISPFK
jgi:hypothetical protein